MKIKTLLKSALAASAALALATPLLADDKETTISGNGMCAKCELKETKKCQNAIQVEKDGKKVTYYLEDNQVSKDFHKTVCTSIEKVKATGTVSEKDGKMQLAATKIEVVK